MTLDSALSINLLRSSEVIVISIDEETSLHVPDGHLDGESLICLECAKVFWEGKLG